MQLLLHLKLLKKIISKAGRKFVKLFKSKKQKPTNIKDANIKDLELSILDKVGLNVNILNKKIIKVKLFLSTKS